MQKKKTQNASSKTRNKKNSYNLIGVTPSISNIGLNGNLVNTIINSLYQTHLLSPNKKNIEYDKLMKTFQKFKRPTNSFNGSNNSNNSKNNYNSNNKQKKNKNKFTSLINLNYVPKIGLENLGKTCFMNSVLQCFSNIFQLSNYFLSPQKENIIRNNTITMENENANSLSIAYKEVIDNLWKGKPNIPYSPYKFKKILGELNSLFKGENAGDSKDFATFLIMQLHEELNNIDQSLINKQNNFFDK